VPEVLKIEVSKTEIVKSDQKILQVKTSEKKQSPPEDEAMTEKTVE